MNTDEFRLSSLPRLGGRAAAGEARRSLATAGNAPAGEAASEAAADAHSAKMMQRAVEGANRVLAEKSRELTFEFNKEAGRVIVKLIDRKTGEVLRQVPSPELLEIARALEADTGAGALLRTDA